MTSSAEKEATPGATVLLVGLDQRTATNRDGVFVFSGLQPGTYDIEVSFVGYKRERVCSVEVMADKETEVFVFLTVSPFLLNEVVVTGSLNKHLLKETPVITEIISENDLSHSGTTEVSEILRTHTVIEMGTGVGQT